MKTTFLLLGFMLIWRLGGLAQTQNGIDLATRIATKMQDSLGLSDSVEQQVYTITLGINRWKVHVINRYQQADSLYLWMNKIETVRDSLYQNVLTNSQYLLYRQRKRSLVLNN